MRNKLAALAQSATALALIGSGAVSSETTKTKAKPMTNRQKTVQLLKSIETGEPGPVAYINPNKYIQHNLAAADGLAGFGALMAQLPKGSAKARTVRSFEDGEFTFTHTEYDFFGPKIGFDIFRWENGLIVEQLETIPESGTGVTVADYPIEILEASEHGIKRVRVFAPGSAPPPKAAAGRRASSRARPRARRSSGRRAPPRFASAAAARWLAARARA